jgi:hypothetical protein
MGDAGKFSATHFLLDTAPFYQLSESSHRFLNRFPVSDQKLYHALTIACPTPQSKCSQFNILDRRCPRGLIPCTGPKGTSNSSDSCWGRPGLPRRFFGSHQYELSPGIRYCRKNIPSRYISPEAINPRFSADSRLQRPVTSIVVGNAVLLASLYFAGACRIYGEILPMFQSLKQLDAKQDQLLKELEDLNTRIENVLALYQSSRSGSVRPAGAAGDIKASEATVEGTSRDVGLPNPPTENRVERNLGQPSHSHKKAA